MANLTNGSGSSDRVNGNYYLLGGQTVNILRGNNTGFGNTGGNTVNNNITR